MRKWTLEYEEDVIIVENKARKCFLYVNGLEVDRQEGFARGHLMGKTSSGESISAFFDFGPAKVRCNLYIDDMVVFKI